MPRISQLQNTHTCADGATVSFLVDVGSAPGRAIALVVGMTGGANSVTSATINGVAANISTILNDTSKNVYGIYRDNITGTGLVTVVLNFFDTGGLARYCYAGYNGINNVRTPVPALGKGSNNAPTMTVTTVADDVVLMLGWDADFAATFTPTAPATSVLPGAVMFGAEETATGISTVIDGTLSLGGVPWAAFAIAMVPIGGANLAGNAQAVSSASAAFPGTNPLAGNAQAVASASAAFHIPTLISTVLKNNSNPVLANTVIPKVLIVKLVDLAVVFNETNVTTNAQGRIVKTDALLSLTDYLIITSNATGTEVGVSKATAA